MQLFLHINENIIHVFAFLFYVTITVTYSHSRAATKSLIHFPSLTGRPTALLQPQWARPGPTAPAADCPPTCRLCLLVATIASLPSSPSRGLVPSVSVLVPVPRQNSAVAGRRQASPSHDSRPHTSGKDRWEVGDELRMQ